MKSDLSAESVEVIFRDMLFSTKLLSSGILKRHAAI